MSEMKTGRAAQLKEVRNDWRIWVGLGLFWSWFWVYVIKPNGLEFEFIAQDSILPYRIIALLSIIICFLVVVIFRLRLPRVKIPRVRYYLIALVAYAIAALIPLFPQGGSAIIEAIQLFFAAIIAVLLFVGWGNIVSVKGAAKTARYTSLALIVAIICSILTFLLDYGQQELLMILFPIISTVLLVGFLTKNSQNLQLDKDSLERLLIRNTPWRFFSVLFFQGMALGVWQFLYDLVVLEKCTAEFCIFREFNNLFITQGLPEFIGFASVIGLILALILVVLSVYAFHLNFRKLIYQVGLPLMALGFLIIAFDGGIVLAGASRMTGDIFIYGEMFHTAGYYYILLIAWVLCSYLITEKKLDGLALFAGSGLLLMLGQLFGYVVSDFLGNIGISGTDLCMLAIFILLTAGLITATGGESLWQDWGNARPTKGASKGIFKQACEDISQSKKLTPRETEVFVLLAHGRNLGFIQSELYISRDTVKSHLRNIYRKLDIHSQQELIDLVELNMAEKRG